MQSIPQGPLQWLMGNTHVMTPSVTVVRNLYGRFRRMMAADQASSAHGRAWRKACYRYALECHESNRQLCRDFNL